MSMTGLPSTRELPCRVRRLLLMVPLVIAVGCSRRPDPVAPPAPAEVRSVTSSMPLSDAKSSPKVK
jgi:hypothetical protein